MFYPKCSEGYAPWGCCQCKKKCPEGMQDLETMCMKGSYQRGTAVYPSCPEGLTLDTISQECYKECKKGTASGPMCWSDCAPGTTPCGGVLCLDDNLKCTSSLRKRVVESLRRLKEEAMGMPEGTAFNAGINFKEHDMPVCEETLGPKD